MRMRGNMGLTTIALAAALLVALLAVDVWMKIEKEPAKEEVAEKSDTTEEEPESDTTEEDSEPETPEDEPEPETPEEDPASDTTEEEPESGMAEGDAEPAKTEEEMQADREEALVDAFDDMVDKWREPVDSDVPMADVEKFRQQFNKIPDARKEECLQRALNLLPDANIMLFAGILIDKEQPREYLDLVFNDLLNRDEAVKKPLLQLIYKDKEHPCWKETAWILDATGDPPKSDVKPPSKPERKEK